MEIYEREEGINRHYIRTIARLNIVRFILKRKTKESR